MIEILRYLAPYKTRIFFNLLFNLLNAAFSVASFGAIVPFLKILFDRVDASGDVPPPVFDGDALTYLNSWFNHYIAEQGPRQALLVFCLAIVVLFLIRNVFRYLAQFQMAFLRNVVVRDIREEVYRKLLALPLAFYTEEQKGNIYARFTSDVGEVEWSVMGALEALFKQPIMILLFLSSLVMISWELTLFVVLVLPVSAILIARIGKSLKRTAKKGQEELGQVVSSLEETVSGIRIIKGFVAEPRFLKSFVSRNDHHFRLMVRMFRKQYLASPVSETLSTITIACILWFGGNLVLDGDMLNGELFILYIAIFSQMISPARALTESFTRVQRGLAASERIDEVLKETMSVPKVENGIKATELQGGIRFDGVHFKYEDRWVLEDISFEVKRGETIALVGPSGGGKSTLVDLMPRFYDVQKGNIYIDDHSVRDYHTASLRNMFGIVSQQSILFNDSVRNNLLLGNPNATDEEIISALHVSNAHGFVMSLPEGLDTVIGESGNKLSGGQKQRLSLARAVLKNPSILILDEATSALDTESERLVQEAMMKLVVGRTSFVIAHRLSTIRHASRILVIENGRIVEEGSHDELMAVGGTYRKLVELQEIDSQS